MICAALPNTSMPRLAGLLSFARAKKVGARIKTANEPFSLSEGKPYLNDLPDEILTCIFEQLDSLSTIYQFALTSRKLNSIAATPRSLCCWLTKQKGQRFSIYYAMLAMPHLCDDHFIRLLFNQGALLPRHLIQQLVTIYGKSTTFPSPASLFTRSIHQLPFSGYAILIHHGFQLYGNILVTSDQDDYHQLMTTASEKNMHAWQVAIDDYCFLPAPVVQGSSSYSRQLIRLAKTRPDLFELISPVFTFDMDARHALWECIFLYLLDLSFTPHPVDHHQDQLTCLSHIPYEACRFAATSIAMKGPGWYGKNSKPADDLDIFAHAFMSFFAKYPIGYCTDAVMHKLLSLCFMHLHPAFGLRHAFTKIMNDLPSTRKDIVHQIDQFLKSQS